MRREGRAGRFSSRKSSTLDLIGVSDLGLDLTPFCPQMRVIL